VVGQPLLPGDVEQEIFGSIALNNKGLKLVKYFFITFAIFILTGELSFAASKSSKNNNQGERRHLGPSLDGGVYGTYGAMTNSDGTIPSRKMDSGSLFLKPGFHFGFFRLALSGEYRFVGQIDSPSGVNNQNLTGNGYNFGALGAFDLRYLRFEGGYQFYGVYSVAQQTSTGQSTNYSNSKGYFFLVGLRLSHHWDLLGIYSALQYNQWNSNGQGIDISANPLTFNSYCLGLNYYFF
jgi:hypothetical protein